MSSRPRGTLLIVLLALALGASATAPAEPDVELVLDINQQPQSKSSEPWGYFEFGGRVFFAANTQSTGYELWRTDGTEAGTELFHEGVSGPEHSWPQGFQEVDGRLWFSDMAGFWVSDGKREGTELVRGGFSGGVLRVRHGILVVGGDAEFGLELWTTDGTREGTQLLKDINPGPRPSVALGWTLLDEVLYFAANDGLSGTELWRSDGSEAGTYQVADLCPGECASAPRGFAILGDSFVLRAHGSAVFGEEDLWVSDGTPAGTRMLREFGSRIGEMDASGGLVYFSAQTATEGSELWKTDGTPEGTALVKDLNPGPDGSAPHDFVDLNGRMIFRTSGPLDGRGVWVSDGSEEGTLQLSKGFLGRIRVIGDEAFFGGDRGPLRSDGTLEGTTEVERIPGLPLAGAFYENIFGRDFGVEPGISNRLFDPPRVLKNLAPDVGDSFPELVAELQERVLFFADDGISGPQLWTTDGSAQGTSLLLEPRPGLSVYRGRAPVLDGAALLVLRVKDVETGEWRAELLRSDGSAGGTELLRVFPQVSDIRRAGQHIYLLVRDEDLATELWRSDGTREGTLLFARPAQDEEFSRAPVGSGDRIYFLSRGPSGQSVLWTSDGTAAGTQRVRSEWPDGRGPGSLTPVEPLVFFRVRNELWRSDGTPQGTFRVDESAPSGVAFDGRMFFVVEHSEVWASDGTTGGTQLVHGFPPDGLLSLFAGADRLFIFQRDRDERTSLWQSDGSPDGLDLIRGFVSVAHDVDVGHPLSVAGGLVFSAAEAGSRVFWLTDGTAEGTVQLLDAPIDITIDGSPQLFPLYAAIGDTLVFAGANSEFGVELFRVPIPRCGNARRDRGEACDVGDGRRVDGCGTQCVFLDAEFSLAGQMLAVIDRRRRDRLLVRSRDPAPELPRLGTPADPVGSGATLALRNPGTGEALEIPLPAEGWQVLEEAGGGRGFVYRDRGRSGRSCTLVRLIGGESLEADCRGVRGLSLDEREQGALTLDLVLGAAPGSARYCMEFGGQVLVDRPRGYWRPGAFVAWDAPAPASCDPD